MTSYRVDIGPRSRKVGRFIARVRSELLKALDEERRASQLKQQAIAEKLDWRRSAINRQLSGEANLTLRSVAELSWALDREISFELRKPIEDRGQNVNAETTTVEWKKPMVINVSDRANVEDGKRRSETLDASALRKDARG